VEIFEVLVANMALALSLLFFWLAMHLISEPERILTLVGRDITQLSPKAVVVEASVVTGK